MRRSSVVEPTTIRDRYAKSAGQPVFDELPLIDIGAVHGNDRGALRATAARVREACESVGFLYVSGHGIPEDVITDALAQTKRFFALPLEAKLQYDIGKLKRHRGYVPVGALSADPAKVDIQEGYEIGLELPRDDPHYVAGHAIYGPNVWPRELPEFQTPIYRYFDAILDLGKKIFRLFAVALELPDDHFAPMLTKPLAQLRLIHYPARDPRSMADGAVGVGAHTDYECFTILWQNEPGLQVQNTAGRWIDATPIPGTFVINIGDMMQRWTNDRFVSTPHRVISTSGKERYSLPFFFAANHDTVVECLESCRGPDNPPRYPPTHFGLWVENMHTYAYAYRYSERGALANPELGVEN